MPYSPSKRAIKKIVKEELDETISKVFYDSIVVSDPPVGYYRVTNLYVNPTNGKLIIIYDNTPVKKD